VKHFSDVAVERALPGSTKAFIHSVSFPPRKRFSGHLAHVRASWWC